MQFWGREGLNPENPTLNTAMAQSLFQYHIVRDSGLSSRPDSDLSLRPSHLFRALVCKTLRVTINFSIALILNAYPHDGWPITKFRLFSIQTTAAATFVVFRKRNSKQL